DCDLDFDAPAAAWIKSTLAVFAPAHESLGNVVSVDFSSRAGTEISRDPVTAEIIEHVNLNSSRSDKETIHLALGFDGAAPAYEPGDSLELFPQNDSSLFDSVLTAAGLQADDALRAALLSERDVTTLSVPLLEKFA